MLEQRKNIKYQNCQLTVSNPVIHLFCIYKYNARANQETAVIIHGYYLLDLKPENLVTWTSCLIPLAATRPGSCLMVAWAEPEEIAAEARVARGSAKISMKCSNYFFECSRGKLEYMILKFKFQTQIYSHIMKFNKFINVLTLILCIEIKIRMKK